VRSRVAAPATLSLAVALAIALPVGCSSREAAPRKSPTDVSGPSVSPATRISVAIGDSAFEPAVIIVGAGTVVEWHNEDTEAHTVTGPGFDSGRLRPGAGYSHTFDRTGTFEYHCDIHPEMKGKITVTD